LMHNPTLNPTRPCVDDNGDTDEAPLQDKIPLTMMEKSKCQEKSTPSL
jgi:hypothetical protein